MDLEKVLNDLRENGAGSVENIHELVKEINTSPENALLAIKLYEAAVNISKDPTGWDYNPFGCEEAAEFYLAGAQIAKKANMTEKEKELYLKVIEEYKAVKRFTDAADIAKKIRMVKMAIKICEEGANKINRWDYDDHVDYRCEVVGTLRHGAFIAREAGMLNKAKKLDEIAERII